MESSSRENPAFLIRRPSNIDTPYTIEITVHGWIAWMNSYDSREIRRKNKVLREERHVENASRETLLPSPPLPDPVVHVSSRFDCGARISPPPSVHLPIGHCFKQKKTNLNLDQTVRKKGRFLEIGSLFSSAIAGLPLLRIRRRVFVPGIWGFVETLTNWDRRREAHECYCFDIQGARVKRSG